MSRGLSVIWQTFWFRHIRPHSRRSFCVCWRPRRDLKSATSGQTSAGLLWMGLMCQPCFMQRGELPVCPVIPRISFLTRLKDGFLDVSRRVFQTTSLDCRFDLAGLLKGRLSASSSVFLSCSRVVVFCFFSFFNCVNQTNILFQK